jgi:hypothetical protein
MRATRLVESACRQTYTRFFRHSAGVMDETAPVFTTNDSLPGTFLHEKALRKQRRRVEPCSLRSRIDHRLRRLKRGGLEKINARCFWSPQHKNTLYSSKGL